MSQCSNLIDIDGKSCLNNKCQYYIIGNNCVTTCDVIHPFIKYDNDKKCVSSCSSLEYIELDGITCVSSCKEGEY